MGTTKEARQKWHDENIMAVRDWIDAHPEYRITLGEIVEKSGYSRAHFSREFNRIVGYNPGRYVKRRALLKAKEQIEAGAPFANALFADIGYANEFAFSRAYRQEFGITPAKHIKQLQKEGNYEY